MIDSTKARFSMGDGLEVTICPGPSVASLGRLGVEAIGLYQMHSGDPDVPLEEALGTLNSFVAQGKIPGYIQGFLQTGAGVEVWRQLGTGRSVD